MEQPALFSLPIQTVTELTLYIRSLLEGDEILQDVWVIGEISNLARPQSGHIYFTLKDENASLRAVIWKMQAFRMHVQIQEGQRVEVHGSISLYEPRGEYQIIIDALRPAGEGILFQEFLRLKARLEVEGLFDLERKRPLPDRPKRIGVVTSESGAAWQDIQNTLYNRYPFAEVIISPSAVQGTDAPKQLVKALHVLEKKHADVILIARGGGSLEDLWAFNDEDLVRAIASSTVPIITGIGHETDFTLADFAADVRAPTPTGAAVMATPEMSELVEEIKDVFSTLGSMVLEQLKSKRNALENLIQTLSALNPLRAIQTRMQSLDSGISKMHALMHHRIDLLFASQSGINARLLSLNPSAILERGYALVYTTDGNLLQTIQKVQVKDWVDIHLHDGELRAQIQSRKEKDTTQPDVMEG